MGDIYFGAVKAGTLVRFPPEWIVNTIMLGGTAIPLAIAEPAGLFVVKLEARYAAVSESGEVAASAEHATPFRVYAAAGGVHYIQIPAGPLDRPSQNKITVLAKKEGKTGIAEMHTQSLRPAYGWKQVGS
jgi:hypothetical protein